MRVSSGSLEAPGCRPAFPFWSGIAPHLSFGPYPSSQESFGYRCAVCATFRGPRCWREVAHRTNHLQSEAGVSASVIASSSRFSWSAVSSPWPRSNRERDALGMSAVTARTSSGRRRRRRRRRCGLRGGSLRLEGCCGCFRIMPRLSQMGGRGRPNVALESRLLPEEGSKPGANEVPVSIPR
jgi:hypothetical protein